MRKTKLDLVTAPAAPHDVVIASKTEQQKALESSTQDLGHRLGNFHNYYAFHPPSDRLEKMKDIIEYIADQITSDPKRTCSAERTLPTFHYCDLGCNEGDLTIELSRALHHSLSRPIDFLGVDIDPVLIQRGTDKWIDSADVTGRFISADICHDLNEAVENNSVDLVSLLSTTMWMHVHVGDDGLRQVLEQICNKARRYVLIEPQPSKCYRNAVVRLRKMGRPALDVSSERLKLRPNIENEIDTIIKNAAFRRVIFADEKTSWNRQLQLYERITDQS